MSVRHPPPLHLLLALVTMLLALVPLAHIVIIVSTTGTNTVSADYLLSVGIVDRMLSATYDWSHFLRDTFLAGEHSFAIPFLARIAIVHLTGWNIYAELYTGIASSLLRLILLYASFTYREKGLSRYLLLPALAALVFSTSQIDDFTFGDAGLQVGFNQLGLALGMWGLIRFRARSVGITLMGLGGLIATLSGGAGLPVWPAFLLGLFVLRDRDIKHYLAWFGAALISCLPYIEFRLLHPVPWTGILAQVPYQRPAIASVLNVPDLIVAMGWPFAQGFSYIQAFSAGVVGTLVTVSGLSLLTHCRRASWMTKASAPLMCLSYGALNMWLVSSQRAAMAAWYAGHFMPFWIGLLGLAFVFWVNRGDSRALRLWSFAVLYSLVFLYARSNLTYADKESYKISFLRSRSPAAASCLRNYRIAPTYCEDYLFTWAPGHPGFLAMMAKPLERHHLSVFAPNQEWTLQGDFVLDTVHLNRNGLANAFWSQTQAASPTPWYDYHHLNLLLRAPNSISWMLHLPANVTRATFHTALASAATSSRPLPHLLAWVSLTEMGKVRRVLAVRELRSGRWRPIAVSLSAYAGKTVTLRLGGRVLDRGGEGWVIYQYPTIGLQVDPRVPGGPEPVGRFIPTPTPRDARLDPLRWKAHQMQAIASSRPTWVIGRNPSLSDPRPPHLCLANYSYLSFRLAASSTIWPRAIFVSYRYTSTAFLPRSGVVAIPLLSDGRMHEYSYDLKLLELPPTAHLAALRLALVTPVRYSAEVPTNQRQVQITDLRLIRGSRSAACGQP